MGGIGHPFFPRKGPRCTYDARTLVSVGFGRQMAAWPALLALLDEFKAGLTVRASRGGGFSVFSGHSGIILSEPRCGHGDLSVSVASR